MGVSVVQGGERTIVGLVQESPSRPVSLKTSLKAIMPKRDPDVRNCHKGDRGCRRMGVGKGKEVKEGGIIRFRHTRGR